jgi:hypothetical protein
LPGLLLHPLLHLLLLLLHLLLHLLLPGLLPPLISELVQTLLNERPSMKRRSSGVLQALLVERPPVHVSGRVKFVDNLRVLDVEIEVIFLRGRSEMVGSVDADLEHRMRFLLTKREKRERGERGLAQRDGGERNNVVLTFPKGHPAQSFSKSAAEKSEGMEYDLKIAAS